MPDIAMCLNRHCAKRDTCLRYLAYPAARQTYAVFGGRTCTSHVSVLSDDKVRSVEEADEAVIRSENSRNLCGND